VSPSVGGRYRAIRRRVLDWAIQAMRARNPGLVVSRRMIGDGTVPGRTLIECHLRLDATRSSVLRAFLPAVETTYDLIEPLQSIGLSRDPRVAFSITKLPSQESIEDCGGVRWLELNDAVWFWETGARTEFRKVAS